MAAVVSPSNEYSFSQNKDLKNKHVQPIVEHHPYRAVPLSTKQIFGIITFLSIFSFIYLIYAQHHKLLFYIMTGLIAAWIAFIYTAGILSVLYMVKFNYNLQPQICEENGEQESSL